MKAGGMRYKLRILRPDVEIGELGGERPVWVPTAVAHAERVKMNGSYGLEVGERFPSYKTEWNIRDAHTVKENWRVEQLGGHLYTVVNITPNRERGMLTLTCERVNE